MQKQRGNALKFVETDLLSVEISARLAESNASTVTARKRLAFVIAHLGHGGAQRVAVNAANALVERGLDVHVIVIDNRTDAYQVDPRVVLHVVSPRAGTAPAVDPTDRASSALEQARAFPVFFTRLPPGALKVFIRHVLTPLFFGIGLIKRAVWLRRRIKAIEADAVLSFLTQTNILTILATRGLKTRTVISERNDPRLQRHRPRVELLRRIVYGRADLVTANSRGALTALEPFVPKHKLAFLPNPLSLTSTSRVAGFNAPTVITVGRLVKQKGLDVLLAAWAKVVEILPDWRLALVGDGPLKSELQRLARELQIENNVDWIGHVSDPFPLLRGAKLFVLTSRFEGTPNALLEAMACALPAVVSDASPGPCELIGLDQSAGLIVPVEDAAATAAAIVALARDEPLRRRLGSVARKRARAHETDQAIDVWVQLLGCE